jgi:hypothetical protein
MQYPHSFALGILSGFPQLAHAGPLSRVRLILLACASHYGLGRTLLLAFSEEEADRKIGPSHSLGVLKRAEDPLPGGGN